MGSPSTVDNGGVAPTLLGSDGPSAAAASMTIITNTVYLYAIEVLVPVSITVMRWRMFATATGHSNLGIYTFAGNLVAGSDTGAIANSASSINSTTLGTAVALSPGQYFLALACDNSTDTYAGVSSGGTHKHRNATNALATGALPLTTGTIIAGTKSLAITALVSGGLT